MAEPGVLKENSTDYRRTATERAASNNVSSPLMKFVDKITSDLEELGLYVYNGKFGVSLNAGDYGGSFSDKDEEYIKEKVSKIGKNIKVSRVINGGKYEDLHISFDLNDKTKEREDGFKKGWYGSRI